jgi:hypothetical protein
VSSFFKLEGGVLVGKEKRNDHLVWVHPKMAKTASSTKLMQWWVLGHTSPFNLVQGKILAILYVSLRAYRMDISNSRIKQFTKVSSKSSGCHYFAMGSCGNRRGLF